MSDEPKDTTVANHSFKEIILQGSSPSRDESFDIMVMWIENVETTLDDAKATEEDIMVSRDTASVTSTVYYKQEAFKTFQVKLFKLVQSVIPLEVSVSTIARMKGGGNNRVAEVTLDWPAGKRFEASGVLLFEARPQVTEVRAVLRCCRWPTRGQSDSDIIDSYAVMVHLVKCGIKAPPILGYDSTCDNPLSIPYLLMVRLPGIRLEDVYDSFSVKQKTRVAKLVAEQLQAFDMIFCSTMGRFTAKPLSVPHKIRFLGDVPDMVDIEISAFMTGQSYKLPVRGSTSLSSLIRRMLANWIEISKRGKGSKPPNLEHIGYYEQLLEILETMKERGYFDRKCRDNIALHHPDFYSRNLLISASCRRPDDMTFKIEGVIDWDDAVALPEILRSSPPSWLWEWEGPCVTNIPIWDEWYGDSDELPIGRFDYKLDPDAKKIKAKFDDIMSPQRLEFMYKDEYIWIRRMWKFGYSGLRIGKDYELHRYHNFVARWAEHVKMTAPRYPGTKSRVPTQFNPTLLQGVVYKSAPERETTPAPKNPDRMEFS